MFDFLDFDGDGSLDEGVSIKNLSEKFFLQVLHEAFVFVHLNQDDTISVKDKPGAFREEIMMEKYL